MSPFPAQPLRSLEGLPLGVVILAMVVRFGPFITLLLAVLLMRSP